jgi:hypothetical protein
MSERLADATAEALSLQMRLEQLSSRAERVHRMMSEDNLSEADKLVWLDVLKLIQAERRAIERELAKGPETENS